MPRTIVFPDPQQADDDGLVAVGGDLQVDMLLAAYQKGIFPWPISPEFPLAWFSPDPRGVLEYRHLHLPHSLKKWLKKQNYHVTFNSAFEQVIWECARSKRKNQSSTWITPDMINGFINFHHAGYAYSVEVWDSDILVGGLYGVKINHFMSGESMFSNKTNASKLALISLMEFMNRHHITWLDTQMVTPVVKSLGGTEISRIEFLERLKNSLGLGVVPFPQNSSSGR